MSILGSIKNKITRKGGEDYSNFRSHVIGTLGEADVEPPRFGKDTSPQDRFALGPPASRSELEAQRFPGERPPVSVEREAEEFGPPYARSPFEREPVSLEQNEKNASYDIADRLNIIEAQLSAIRSQTETINERLKNIEMRLPRRY